MDFSIDQVYGLLNRTYNGLRKWSRRKIAHAMLNTNSTLLTSSTNVHYAKDERNMFGFS